MLKDDIDLQETYCLSVLEAFYDSQNIDSLSLDHNEDVHIKLNAHMCLEKPSPCILKIKRLETKQSKDLGEQEHQSAETGC